MSNKWVDKAVEFEKLGRRNVAIHCLNRATEFNPRDADAWFLKAVILGKMGNHEEELNCYSQVLEINPYHAKAWFNKGAVLGNFGRYREALYHFEEAKRMGHPRANQAIDDCQAELEKSKFKSKLNTR
ncbi:MAG TPA: tetratricopeptide repeat protein [bacterium]|jgi:tetratricopeptide (TPR) repeat protein